jgi:ubiquinone/menaquinone biosynthesis C-methylase UbiE
VSLEASPRRVVDELYDSLATHYDDHFAVAHRKAYDDLAWQMCEPLWQGDALTIVDVGCGVGRWAERWLTAGHRVIGIEPSPGMAHEAATRLSRWQGDTFTLLRGPLEDADLEPASIDVVVAMGSLQYTESPTLEITRMAKWLKPGGSMAVLVDSLWGLVVELTRRGDTDQATERLQTRQGLWQVGDLAAPLHLLDAKALRSAASDAGMTHIEVSGLLVGASFWGLDALRSRLTFAETRALRLEQSLADQEGLANLGKQLLLRARS